MTPTRRRRKNDSIEKAKQEAFIAHLAAQVSDMREASGRSGKSRTWTKATLIGFATALITVASALPGCAGTIGNKYEQTPDKISSTNAAPYRTTISDNSGEHHVLEGGTTQVYTLADADQARSLANGSTPTNLHAQRDATGKAAFSLFSAANNTIEADSFTYNPETGLLQGEGVRIGGNAAETTRATNEALIPLTNYWAQRDQASKEALIEQIRTTGKIPGELAPFIVQLLLGL
ncbi:MAG: hypothetical protein JSS51_04080 [Planctomycetes bacterium]|nr:hypothetical protein [Planctomycetota bacterium]